MLAGIAKEMSRFEDTALHPSTYAVLLIFSSTEFCCNGLCAISLNSPVQDFFPGNGKFFPDQGKSSPVNVLN